MRPKEFPEIKTSAFLLRQFVSADVNAVYHGLSHPDVIKYYGVSYTSLAATKVQMEWFKELEINETGIWWALCAPDNSEFYGAVGLSSLSKTHQKAEIGFWLLPEFWGKGLMKPAAELILDYAFNQAKLHRIEALIETKNQNSKNLAIKLGFVHEGTMQDCEIKDGAFISLAMYAKLAP